MNLVDTSGWIEYLFDGPGADDFADVIEDTGDLLVSSICQYEVFKKINRVADEAMALKAIALMRQGSVVDITEDIALSAALVSIRHQLPMADSLIYATAKMYDAILWTQDAHFQNLPGVNFIKPKRR